MKKWPLAVVLSITTGRLFCKIEEVYKIAKWSSGEPVWTHQLPRVGKEMASSFICQHPDLHGVNVDNVTPENLAEVLSKFEAIFGKEIELQPMSQGEHEPIDFMSELAEKIHPDRIATVVHD